MIVKKDPRHLYVQVIERLKQDIESGVFKENEKLPSEFKLAEMLGVSRATLREALRVLEEDRVIIRKHGVGTFVNPRTVFSSGIEQLTSISTMIRQADLEPGTDILDISTTPLSGKMKERFHAEEGETLVKIKRIRTANGEPVVYCIDHLLLKNLPAGIESLEEISLFDTIERLGDIRIVQAVAEIEPINTHPEAFEALNCSKQFPLLALSQYHYSEEGEMVLYSKNYFRADKFRFHVVRKRV